MCVFVCVCVCVPLVWLDTVHAPVYICVCYFVKAYALSKLCDFVCLFFFLFSVKLEINQLAVEKIKQFEGGDGGGGRGVTDLESLVSVHTIQVISKSHLKKNNFC